MSDPAPGLAGIGAVFIDDIVLPDGRTHMGRLGGGVVHALMGAAIWHQRPGIVAVTGAGLPAAALAHLRRHLDTRGLHTLDLPQIRAWQIFEHDGTRRELYRVEQTEAFTRGAQPQHFPPAYAATRAFYLHQGFDGIRAWREKLSGTLLWEPLQQAMTPENRARFRATLRDCAIDIVSPNLKEARMIYGNLPPEALIAALFEDGARTVALRMGGAGSLVVDRESGTQQHIGAVPLRAIIDQTGAGNTYCGGLLAGFVQGKSPREAAVMGAVSASFCLEHIGVLDPAKAAPDERDARRRRLQPG